MSFGAEKKKRVGGRYSEWIDGVDDDPTVDEASVNTQPLPRLATPTVPIQVPTPRPLGVTSRPVSTEPYLFGPAVARGPHVVEESLPPSSAPTRPAMAIDRDLGGDTLRAARPDLRPRAGEAQVDTPRVEVPPPPPAPSSPPAPLPQLEASPPPTALRSIASPSPVMPPRAVVAPAPAAPRPLPSSIPPAVADRPRSIPPRSRAVGVVTLLGLVSLAAVLLLVRQLGFFEGAPAFDARSAATPSPAPLPPPPQELPPEIPLPVELPPSEPALPPSEVAPVHEAVATREVEPAPAAVVAAPQRAAASVPAPASPPRAAKGDSAAPRPDPHGDQTLKIEE